MEAPPGHHSVKDVAERHRINMKSIQKRISRGTMKVLRVEDRVFIPDESVTLLLKTYRPDPTRNRFR